MQKASVTTQIPESKTAFWNWEAVKISSQFLRPLSASWRHAVQRILVHSKLIRMTSKKTPLTTQQHQVEEQIDVIYI